MLSERDYLDLIGVVHKLQECETQSSLETVVQTDLFPLLQIQAFGSAWIDVDLTKNAPGKPVPIATVGFTHDDKGLTPEFQPYFTEFAKLHDGGLRTVLACGIDLPREAVRNDLNRFFTTHPEYNHSQYPLHQNITSHITMVDPSDRSIVIGLIRLAPNEAPFTHRERRMAELLQPSLAHAIRYITLRRDLSRFSALAEHLADVPAPIALVQPEGGIMFCNAAFETLFRLERGDPLTEDLASRVRDQDDLFSPSERFSGTECLPVFYKINKQVYRLSLTRLDPMEDYQGRCWLLKFKPALDAQSQVTCAMHCARLSARETEVAALVCDGFSDKEIAERLFISPNTVNNHLKHIFKKMDVRTRVQLANRLQGIMRGERNEKS